jgi:hypothetical protein
MNKNGCILAIQMIFQRSCLMSAYVNTNKNKWLEK